MPGVGIASGPTDVNERVEGYSVTCGGVKELGNWGTGELENWRTEKLGAALGYS
jgi:hypothetical protein